MVAFGVVVVRVCHQVWRLDWDGTRSAVAARKRQEIWWALSCKLLSTVINCSQRRDRCAGGAEGVVGFIRREGFVRTFAGIPVAQCLAAPHQHQLLTGGGGSIRHDQSGWGRQHSCTATRTRRPRPTTSRSCGFEGGGRGSTWQSSEGTSELKWEARSFGVGEF